MKTVLVFAATVVLVSIAVLSGGLAWVQGGQTDSPERADPPSEARLQGGPGIVRVYYFDPTLGNQLLLSFEAQLLETNYEASYHVMQLTPHEIALLIRAGLRVEADPRWRPQRRQETGTPSIASPGIPGYPCYRTVEETFATAQQIVEDHPDLATWVDMGDSWERTAGLGGYDLRVLRLTHSALPGPKPTLFISAAMHAREYATAELVTRFAEYLVDRYGTDADVTWILDYHQVHLMLQANPDGRKQAEAGLLWRKNTNREYCDATSTRRGADLNRNFGFQWNCCGGSSDNECDWTYHGPYASSEPEVQAIQDYLQAIFPDQRGPDMTDPAPDEATGIYVDVHTYGQLVIWPWDFDERVAPNGAQLQTLGRKFAYWNGYSPQQAIGLYPADGTGNDYAYGQLGVAAYVFELGTRHFQSCSDFEDVIVPDNLPALLYAAKVVRTPYITPAGPDSVDLSLSDNPVPAGTNVTLRFTVDDTRYNHGNGAEPAQDVAAAEVYVDMPPWESGATAIVMSASDGGFDQTVESVEASIDTSGWSEGRHTLYVRGQDASGNWGAVSAIYLGVSSGPNMPPVATFTHRCIGLWCQFDGSGSYDPDGSIVSYSWAFGDGGTGSGVMASHTYVTSNTYPITLTLTDDAGASGAHTERVPVDDRRTTLYLPHIAR
jgi:carboxypeptidase T